MAWCWDIKIVVLGRHFWGVRTSISWSSIVKIVVLERYIRGLGTSKTWCWNIEFVVKEHQTFFGGFLAGICHDLPVVLEHQNRGIGTSFSGSFRGSGRGV